MTPNEQAEPIFIEEQADQHEMVRSELRIVQPATVFYEVGTNTFLLLALLNRMSEESFTSKVSQIFGKLWSDSLHSSAKSFHQCCILSWSHVQLHTGDPFVQAKLFVSDLRGRICEQWNKEVVQKLSKGTKKNHKAGKKLIISASEPQKLGSEQR